MEWIKQKKSIVLLLSAVEKDREKAYKLFLSWQKDVDFSRNFSVSELNLLTFIWYRLSDKMLESNKKYNIYKGLFKKNIVLNTQAFSQISNVVSALNTSKYKYAFVGDLAFNYFIYSSKGIRAIKQFEIIVEKNSLWHMIEDLSKIGYQKTSKSNNLKPLETFVLLNHANQASIKIHFQPSIFYKNLRIIPSFLRQTEEVCYNHIKIPFLKKEALFCYTFLSNQHSSNFSWLVDWIELKKKYDVSSIDLKNMLNQSVLGESNRVYFKKISVISSVSDFELIKEPYRTALVDRVLLIENRFAFNFARILAASDKDFSVFEIKVIKHIIIVLLRQFFV